MSQAYVVGFLFRFAGRQVALIQKNKPQWQAGLLNGIGGKIEPGETPLEAMIREFREEAGAVIATWDEFFVLSVPGVCKVHFFKAHFEDPLTLRTLTEEIVGWFNVTPLWDSTRHTPDTLPNLRWLIPMALDPSRPVGVAENQA